MILILGRALAGVCGAGLADEPADGAGADVGFGSAGAGVAAAVLTLIFGFGAGVCFGVGAESPVGSGRRTTSPDGSGLRIFSGVSLDELGPAPGRAVRLGPGPGVDERVLPRITASRLGLAVFNVTMRLFFH